MKICMVVPDPLVKGGIASVVNGYRKSALEQKHEIYYVESYRNGSKAEKLMKAVTGYFAFLKTLLFKRPDIVHVHSSFGPSFYRKMPFIYLSRWAHVPVVNHIHGAEFAGFYENASGRKKKLVQKVYGKCSRFIVLSKEWKEKISQIVSSDKIDIIENYCILPDIPYDRGRNRSRILFMGELGERKGCYDIPVIFDKVKKNCPDARLIMAGDGEMQQVKEAFQRKNLLSDAEFPGWVRGADKKRLFEESSIFLFPSYYEGMPMAVLEAMSYGLGIVSTTVGGIPQLIRNGESGYLERPGNVEQIADDVIRLLENETERCRMGQQARNAAGQKYSLEAHLQKLEQTYRKTRKLG